MPKKEKKLNFRFIVDDMSKKRTEFADLLENTTGELKIVFDKKMPLRITPQGIRRGYCARFEVELQEDGTSVTKPKK